MSRQDKQTTAGLRDAAEARLQAAAPEPVAAAATDDLRRLVHELQVHKIELEMQNNELRQSRAEREAALTRYIDLYDFAPVGYLTLTAEGLIAQINLTGATLLGALRSHLLNKRFNSFVIDEDRPRWAGFLASVKTHEGQDHVELALQRGDGTRFDAQLDCVRHGVDACRPARRNSRQTESGSALRPASGTLEVSIALTDISVRKGVEARLNEAMAAAEKANRAKTDFLSGMSHELRTPLNAILGFAQLMESGTPPPTVSQRRNLDRILTAGWYLLELINEILDLALIESGKAMLSREPVSLGAVMLECRAMIEPQAHQRGIRMTFPAFAQPCFISADPTRLKQVLINLLFNAIKYNKADGAVDVEYSLKTPTTLRISVRDTGAGLAPEQMAQLFQPFNRLGRETGVEEGTGIGLVVTKRLVELMGGRIGVDSSVGAGSEFWIELAVSSEPLLTLQEAAPAAVARRSLAADAPLRAVLYVEDNPANMELVEQLIARRPELRLLCAADGHLGIEFARVYQPRVILMDISLPGISGIEAMKVLRADPATAHIPIIALSANAIPRDIAQGLAAGFFRYLTKPIKVHEFMATLDVALKFAEAAPPTTRS